MTQPIINENLEAARQYIALEVSLIRGETTLPEVIQAFNALTPADRSYLSQAHAEAKMAWLNSQRTSK